MPTVSIPLKLPTLLDALAARPRTIACGQHALASLTFRFRPTTLFTVQMDPPPLFLALFWLRGTRFHRHGVIRSRRFGRGRFRGFQGGRLGSVPEMAFSGDRVLAWFCFLAGGWRVGLEV